MLSWWLPGCKLAPKEVAAWQLETNPSPMLNVKTFLYVIVVVILRMNTAKLNRDFKVGETLHQNKVQFSCHLIRCHLKCTVEPSLP